MTGKNVSKITHDWQRVTTIEKSFVEKVLTGSFRNDDGNGNENVISKYKFELLQSLCDYSKLFNKTKVWQSLRNETVMSGA